MKAPIPENESARLAALRQYDLLDSEPERAFDDITLLASQICSAPIALISLVDENRQWFKSKRGLTLSETPRAGSICAHAILEADVFVVQDAQLDARFASSPLVTGPPGIRFYAGAQLVTPAGHTIGMLCVIDQQPRCLVPEQAEALRVLARQTVTQLELHRHVGELSETLLQRQRAEAALRQAEERLRDIFEHTAEGIFQTTPSGRLLTANPSFVRLFGYESREALIRDTTDIATQFYCEPQRRAEFQRLLAQDGAVDGFEAEFHRRGGERFWISMSARAVRDPEGGLLYYEGTLKDISERKAAQEALRRSHGELEQRVEERTRELLLANGSLSAEIESRKLAQATLESMQKKFMEASRQAGKAELATEILHNVGNVINSINVSSALLSEMVRNSKGVDLSKAVALLQAHAEDLPGFFATNPKGQKLIGYLSSLSSQIFEEQANLLKELTDLCGSLEHIREIISLQQSYGKVSGLREALGAADLVQQALRLNVRALAKHAIQLQRDYVEAPPVCAEKHKVLQILVNLIQNAQQALESNEFNDRKVTVRVAPLPGGLVSISVSDNGKGISAEHLSRLFEHGFTTRTEGHGFGLHSGLLAAKEMGGGLTAQSDGPGKGATFTLLLPSR